MYVFIISYRLIYWTAVTEMNVSIEWITESFSQSFHSKTQHSRRNETPLYVAVALFVNAKIEKIYNIDKTMPKK